MRHEQCRKSISIIRKIISYHGNSGHHQAVIRFDEIVSGKLPQDAHIQMETRDQYATNVFYVEVNSLKAQSIDARIKDRGMSNHKTHNCCQETLGNEICTLAPVLGHLWQHTTTER